MLSAALILAAAQAPRLEAAKVLTVCAGEPLRIEARARPCAGREFRLAARASSENESVEARVFSGEHGEFVVVLPALAPGDWKVQLGPLQWKEEDETEWRSARGATVRVEAEGFGFSHLCLVAGGLALFVYGISGASSGLRRAAGGKLRAVLSLLTRSRFIALLAGVALTVVLQSSSAATVMLVGLVASGMMNLRRAVAVILGAGVGTSLTVQIIAFNVSSWALVAIALGTVLSLVFNRRTAGYAGRVVLGFGLVFYGMHVMKMGVEPLKSWEAARDAFATLAEHPVLAALAAAALTGIVQSSAATIGLVMALASGGVLDLRGAIPFVLGANIGTCATAFLGAAGTGGQGLGVAFARIIAKAAGAVVVLPLVALFSSAIELGGGGIERQIAHAHTIYNVAIALLFLPFVGQLEALSSRLSRRFGKGKRRPFYLSSASAETPAMALLRARKEIKRMGDASVEMAEKGPGFFEGERLDLAYELRQADDLLDDLHEALVEHLAGLARSDLTSAQAGELATMLYLSNEIERVGDLVSKDLATMGEKKISAGKEFSLEGAAQLRRLYSEILDNLRAVVAGIDSEGASLEGVVEADSRIDERARALEFSHFERVRKRVAEAVETDAIFTDLVHVLRQMHYHVAAMARILSEGEARK